MLEVKTNKIQLRMDDNNLKFSFGKGDTEWNWTSEYRPKMECKEGTVYFDEALEIHHELVQNRIGKGIRSSFAGFEIEGKKFHMHLKLMHGLKNVQKTFSLNGFRFVRKGLRWKNCSGRENWNWKKREKTGIRS